MSLRAANSSNIPDSSALYPIEVFKLPILGVLKEVKRTAKDSKFHADSNKLNKSRNFGVTNRDNGEGKFGSMERPVLHFSCARFLYFYDIADSRKGRKMLKDCY